MSGGILAFFLLSLIAIAGGVFMINLQKVVHVIVALAFTFISIGGLYVLLAAEFVAFVQILIYGGAISIMMLFAIMLTKHDDEEKGNRRRLHSWLVILGIFVFFVTMFRGINGLTLGEPGTGFEMENARQIGLAIYSHYVIPFEVVGVILLVALVGAVSLAKQDDKEVNHHE
ncbi:NADH-quinone oxidoreductase subunit J [Halalkalibacterium ligniniphilum]|uniref:NADH-quinone oxidoreductase subunit J n=1 Tax=Halalkalibacterium ligniniphilum TaxID=1134413 RepID=UPI000348673A|nr:NADH-quinone oxidoreductase subunit J [Halalkalibacterium ligniniphilum]